jgi:hypothetical protein
MGLSVSKENPERYGFAFVNIHFGVAAELLLSAEDANRLIFFA